MFSFQEIKFLIRFLWYQDSCITLHFTYKKGIKKNKLQCMYELHV